MASTGMIVVMGFFMFLNIAVIKYKFENDRIADAWFDLSVLVILGWLLSGTISGLAMGTIASACLSGWLLISPPDMEKFKKWMDEDEED